MSEKHFHLKAELPEAAAAVARQRFGEDSKWRLAVPGDMLLNGQFGNAWLLMNDSQLGVLSENGAGVEVSAEYTFEQIEELSVKPGISSAVIEVKKGNFRERLMRISNVRQKDFSEAVRMINTWLKEKEWKPESIDAPNVCPRCGRPLTDEMSVCPRCMDKGKLMLKVLSFLKPYKRDVTMIFILMTTRTGIGLVAPYLSMILVDDVIKPVQNFHWLPFLVLGMVVCFVAESLFEMLTWKRSAYLGTSAVCDVRGAMFHKLQELSLSFYSRHKAGSLITRVNQDTGQFNRLLVDFVPEGISCILTGIGVLALLLYLSWILTLFMFLPIIGIVIIVRKFFPQFRIYWQRHFEKRSRLSSFVENVVNGVRVVKVFNQERSEKSRFDFHSTAYRDTEYAAELRFATVFPMMHALIMSGMPLVWLIGGWLVFHDKMTLGAIFAFTGYLGMLFRPVIMLTRLAQMVPNTLAAASRVFDIIDSEPEIADAPNAVSMPDIQGKIEFKDVTFGYHVDKPVLHDITSKIEAKEMIGLVGKSGAGKSTFVNLLCRLFETDAGHIFIDGVDIRDIKYEDLRNQIGFVMQETFLLDGTIAENIAYGRPNATIFDIIKASKAANAHDFIMSKPDGYDTELSKGGGNLSSGEKQRLSIARAILCDPKILILDEATASVDLETEKQIQEAIERMVKQRTTIAIAHRLSTLRNASRLIVLDKGKLVEQGTHQELVEMDDGVYHRLVNLHKETSEIQAVEG
ncbi:ABC transporter ATP-binding protein [Candidatus Sumerlaeota bacterium]|nr:ABC transporter ATP-binding protein [Candidatus Sumerlaeota bacterium]